MSVTRILRLDAYPEGMTFIDPGCKEVAPHCVECWLPVCRYEVKGGLRALLNRQRDEWIREARAGGGKVAEIAQIMHISERTVCRA